MSTAAPTTALATIDARTTQIATTFNMPPERVDLLKRTFAQGTTDDELALFVATAVRLGLDPFAKQIHCVKRWNGKLKREVMSIQVGIDGLRLAGFRSNAVDGVDGPYWCGEDGQWTDVWLSRDVPRAARCMLYRKGIIKPFTATVLWDACVQTYWDESAKANVPNQMWGRQGPHMLGKCAEAAAWRKAFPMELAGAHMPEEIHDDALDVSFTETVGPGGVPANVQPFKAPAPQLVAPPEVQPQAAAEPAKAPAKPKAPAKAKDSPLPEDPARDSAFDKAKDNARVLDEERRAKAAAAAKPANAEPAPPTAEELERAAAAETAIDAGSKATSQVAPAAGDDDAFGSPEPEPTKERTFAQFIALTEGATNATTLTVLKDPQGPWAKWAGTPEGRPHATAMRDAIKAARIRLEGGK